MATIEVDTDTAEALDAQARALGISVRDFLRLFVLREKPSPVSPEEYERLVDGLSFSGPSLPPDFSRADIYDRHD